MWVRLRQRGGPSRSEPRVTIPGSEYPSRRVWPRPTSAVSALHRQARPTVSATSPPLRAYMLAGSPGQR